MASSPLLLQQKRNHPALRGGGTNRHFPPSRGLAQDGIVKPGVPKIIATMKNSHPDEEDKVIISPKQELSGRGVQDFPFLMETQGSTSFSTSSSSLQHLERSFSGLSHGGRGDDHDAAGESSLNGFPYSPNDAGGSFSGVVSSHQHHESFSGLSQQHCRNAGESLNDGSSSQQNGRDYAGQSFSGAAVSPQQYGDSGRSFSGLSHHSRSHRRDAGGSFSQHGRDPGRSFSGVSQHRGHDAGLGSLSPVSGLSHSHDTGSVTGLFQRFPEDSVAPDPRDTLFDQGFQGSVYSCSPEIEYKNVESPEDSSAKNKHPFCLTFEDCDGRLEWLPLQQPNANQRDPNTTVEMVNILANRKSALALENAMDLPTKAEALIKMTEEEYNSRQSSVFDPGSSVMKQCKQLAKKDTRHMGAIGKSGKVVPPGHIRFYERDSKVYAVGEGRWALRPGYPRAQWIGDASVSLDQDRIHTEGSPLMIIRIPFGKIGLVRKSGKHMLLDAGVHVFNSGDVIFDDTVDSGAGINYGPWHCIPVPSGQYALCWTDVVRNGKKFRGPKLLSEGEHVILSPKFELKGFKPVSDPADPYLKHDTIHVLSIEKGHVAKVFHDNLPRLLGEGDHFIQSDSFEFTGEIVSLSEDLLITHGTMTIVRVRQGTIGLAYFRDKPFFMEKEGLYEYDDIAFRFVGFQDSSKKIIELGPLKSVRVYNGEVGVSYDAQGNLAILKEGQYVLNLSKQKFQGFLSLKEQSVRLYSISNAAKRHKKASVLYNPDTGFKGSLLNSKFEHEEDATLICDTKEFVQIAFRSDVFYQVVHPEKCLRKINFSDIEDLIREKAVSTLTNMVRLTPLNQIAQAHGVHATDTQIPVSAFWDRAHHEIIPKLHQYFWERYGIEVTNINIETCEIQDKEMCKKIAQHALHTASNEAKVANLKTVDQIRKQTEATNAAVRLKKAETEVEIKRMAREHNCDFVKKDAGAEAERITITKNAETEAKAFEVRKMGEATGQKMRYETAANAERWNILQRNRAAQVETALKLQSETVAAANQGVSKVVYMDTNQQNHALSLAGNLCMMDQAAEVLHEARNGVQPYERNQRARLTPTASPCGYETA